MKINDEILSAFLDAALPEADMEQIRQQLQQDDTLTERLAELAMVDTLVQQHYEQINQQPLPDGVLQLLDEAAQPATAQVIAFPWWRSAQQQLQRHAAAVAFIALFAGYGIAQLAMSPPAGNGLTAAVAQLLHSAASGQSYTVDEQRLTPRLSFINQHGEFCRQYALQSRTRYSESIACRSNGQWQQQASLILPSTANDGQYQTASGGSALDSVLDGMMAGPPLTAAAEQQYLTGTTP